MTGSLLEVMTVACTTGYTNLDQKTQKEKDVIADSCFIKT
jgi:fructose-1,6-bisphosphatase